MKMLVLIRHAKSSWDDASVADIDRPLNGRGRKDADAMSERLLARVPRINVFISSPARRAKTTAEKFAQAYHQGKKAVTIDERLYLAPASYYNTCIANIEDEANTAAIFAHNPGITDFVNTLTAAVHTDNVPTCGIFAVTAKVNSWKEFIEAEKAFSFFDYPKLHA